MNMMFDTLAQQVANILAKYDQATAQRWLQSYEDTPLESIEQQQCNINHYWRIQLGLCTDALTIDIRSNLLDRCPVEDWLRLFESRVAPHIVHLGLPVPHDILLKMLPDPNGL